MNRLPQAIQEQIAAWLRSGAIEVFIGYEQGPVPLEATPAFIRDPQEVERLIWDATCENNLVAFLPNYRGKKVGLMVKGCDSRAINGLLQEGQIQRENVKLVGVHCAGVIDPKKVAERTGVTVEALDEVALEGDALRADATTLAVADVIYDLCAACAQHNPVVADVAIGDVIADVEVDDVYAHVREMEALSPDERWARFAQELERCNLCYACRNACPMCYCNVCFVDRTMPRWFNQTATPQDVQFYQIMRTFHLAGRCVGCGACTRACPQGVNLRLMLDKLRLDCLELFDYEAGLHPEVEPPLRTFRQDDYNDFIMSD